MEDLERAAGTLNGGKTVGGQVTMRKIFLTAFLLFASDNLIAKETTLALGYIGNFPKMTTGFSFMVIGKTGRGLYVDGKTNGKTVSDDLYGDISINQAENIWGDSLIGTSKAWTCWEVGVIKTLNSTFGVYGGIGFFKTKFYRRYYDSFEILGSHGKYWINDSQKNDSGVNLNVGAIAFPSKRILILAGYTTKPSGINLGISYMFTMSQVNNLFKGGK